MKYPQGNKPVKCWTEDNHTTPQTETPQQRPSVKASRLLIAEYQNCWMQSTK